jgi:hypothetical protein
MDAYVWRKWMQHLMKIAQWFNGHKKFNVFICLYHTSRRTKSIYVYIDGWLAIYVCVYVLCSMEVDVRVFQNDCDLQRWTVLSILIGHHSLWTSSGCKRMSHVYLRFCCRYHCMTVSWVVDVRYLAIAFLVGDHNVSNGIISE